VESYKSNLARSRFGERGWDDTRKCREPDGQPDELSTRSGTEPIQPGQEYAADHRPDDGDLGEASEWDLSVHG
jgi:hypothetical protein